MPMCQDVCNFCWRLAVKIVIPRYQFWEVEKEETVVESKK